jgi:hypothetical protein
LIRELTAVATKSGLASISYAGPPDYATTVIQFRTVDGRIYGLSSWHELREANGDWVVTERGSIKLERAQISQKVLRDNSGEYYMKFRVH